MMGMPSRFGQPSRRARKPKVVGVSVGTSSVSPVEKAWKLQAHLVFGRAIMAVAVGQKSVVVAPTFREATIGSAAAKLPWTWSANSDQNVATSGGEPTVGGETAVG